MEETIGLNRDRLLHLFNSRFHNKEIPDAQIRAEISSENCLPFGQEGKMTIFLKLSDEGKIGQAAYSSHPCCVGAIVAAEILCTLVEGKTPDQVLAIKKRELEKKLPIESVKPCQTMALTAMKKGIREWRKQTRAAGDNPA